MLRAAWSHAHLSAVCSPGPITHTVRAASRAPQDDFKAAAEEAKTLPSGVSNEDQLTLYGLFKQANMGDNETCACAGAVGPRARGCSGCGALRRAPRCSWGLVALHVAEAHARHGARRAARPGMFDLKGKAKWDAWTANKGARRVLRGAPARAHLRKVLRLHFFRAAGADGTAPAQAWPRRRP